MGTTNSFILFIINMIHLMVILFVLLVPFSNNTLLLLFHTIAVPFIMFHWILNNDTCAITLAEKYVRTQMNGGKQVQDKECFSHMIVGPIYNFTNNYVNHSQLTWVITIIAWLISANKTYINYKNGSLYDLLHTRINNHINI